LLSVGLVEASACIQHRFGDPEIGAAPAEISAHAFPHTLGVVPGLTFLDQTDCAHDLAWSAEPALKAVMRDERGLDGMEFVTLCQALDREHMCAIVTDRESKAGIDSSSVDQDRAGAALPAVAPLLGSGKVEAFAKKIQKGDPRVFQLDRPRYTVHGESN
jgi:hypothetical protein